MRRPWLRCRRRRPVCPLRWPSRCPAVQADDAFVAWLDDIKARRLAALTPDEIDALPF